MRCDSIAAYLVSSAPIDHSHYADPPYEFKDADTIKSAGEDKINQDLNDTRNQHKGKTTEEPELIFETIAHKDWYDDVEKIFLIMWNDISML